MLSAAKVCLLPLAMVLHSIPNNDSWQASLQVQQMVLEADLPLFLSMGGAAQAIHKLVQYGRAHPTLLPKRTASQSI